MSKTAGGVTTNYLVDTNNLTGYAQVVEEIVSGDVSKQYTYGHDLISQRQGPTIRFYQYDGHGSVRQLTDVSASVTDMYAYDAFGTLIERTGTTDNNYLYAGEQFDPDLGLYYNRARYLDVETARFVSQDTFEGALTDPLTQHKYLYTGNDPINRVDPTGNFVNNLDLLGGQGARYTLGNISTPMYQRTLAGVATALLVGGFAVLPLAELNSGLAQARTGLKEKIERERKRGGDLDLLYHYTSRENATLIAGTGVILASSDFRSPRLGITFPAGAYATDIPPWTPAFTQSALSALFYGGNEGRDVSNFVAIKKNDFIPVVDQVLRINSIVRHHRAFQYPLTLYLWGRT